MLDVHNKTNISLCICTHDVDGIIANLNVLLMWDTITLHWCE